MAAPSHQSRFAELVDLLKAEYDRLSTENASYKGIRGEWSRKVEEQASELSAMLAEFHDLERKHQLVKEQYEAEIMRLKGQGPPPQSAAAAAQQHHQQHQAAAAAAAAAAGIPSSQLPHAGPVNPAAAAAAVKRRSVPGLPDSASQIPPYSANIQGEQPGLPTMFASRGIATHQQSLSGQPGQQQGQPGQPNQQGPPVRLVGLSSLPPAPIPSGNPSAISAMNPTAPGAIARATGTGLSNKMPSMSLMPPNGTAPGRDSNPMAHGIKKDPSLSMGPGMGPGALGGVSGGVSAGGPGGGPGGAAVDGVAAGAGGNGSGGTGVSVGIPGSGSGPGGVGTSGSMGAGRPFNAASGGPGGMMQTPGSNVAPQATNEDDWAVYQGRAANGSLVNMKVSLQNSLGLDSVVCCVRYSWDGNYLATGSNRAAHIFDASTGRTVATFSKDPGTGEDGSHQDSYVRAVCFSPDGNWLITGAEDHVVKVWDVRNRKVKHRLVGHGTDIYSVDASANSQFIISGSGDKRAKLWSLETGKLLSTLGGGEYGPTDGITSVSVSPTSQHVAAGSLDKVVRVWDVESGRLVRQFEGHRDSVYSVAFSPDGRMLLSGSLDKSLKLWNLAAAQPTSQCRMSFTGHKDFVLSVAFSPNGRWLISGSKDRTVHFWDPRQSAMCLMLQGHKNSVISIAHNPQSKSLATGSGDCRARTWVYASS